MDLVGNFKINDAIDKKHWGYKFTFSIVNSFSYSFLTYILHYNVNVNVVNASRLVKKKMYFDLNVIFSNQSNLKVQRDFED